VPEHFSYLWASLKLNQMSAKKGDAVAVHYTGRLEDGSIFDSSVSRSPLSFTLGDGNGQPMPVTVVDMDEEKITLDANHELAGKDLIFDIELVSIN